MIRFKKKAMKKKESIEGAKGPKKCRKVGRKTRKRHIYHSVSVSITCKKTCLGTSFSRSSSRALSLKEAGLLHLALPILRISASVFVDK